MGYSVIDNADSHRLRADLACVEVDGSDPCALNDVVQHVAPRRGDGDHVVALLQVEHLCRRERMNLLSQDLEP